MPYLKEIEPKEKPEIRYNVSRNVIDHLIKNLKFSMKTALEIIGHFDGQLAQLVVCDGAPDGWLADFQKTINF